MCAISRNFNRQKYIFTSLPIFLSGHGLIQSKAFKDFAKDISKIAGKDVTAKDFGKDSFFFSFPNLFDIYFDGPIGDKIDGFLPAVCTSAEVNYTGGQKFATFYDGQPVKVSLALSFQEIRVMTRSNYEQISAKGFEGKVGKEKNLAGKSGQSLVEKEVG